MGFLSNFKITHKLIAIGAVSIFFSLIISIVFQYTFFLEKKIHEKEVELHEIFERVWSIKLNAHISRIIERDLFKGGDMDAESDFIHYQKIIVNDIVEIKRFFSDDSEALTIIGEVEKNQALYSNVANSIIKEYKDNNLRPITNIMDYMPNARLISLRLKDLLIPNRIVLEWIDTRRQELFFLGDRDPTLLPKYHSSMDKFRLSILQLDMNSNDKNKFILLLDQHKQYFITVSTVFQSVWEKEKQLKVIVDNYTHFLSALKTHADSNFLNKEMYVNQTQLYILVLFYSLLTVSIVLLATCLLIIVRSVKDSTNSVKDMLKGIALGDELLSERLPEIGKNEMTEVAHWFNHLVDKLQETIITIGDLSCRLTDLSFSVQKRRDETSSVFEGQIGHVHSISSLVSDVDKKITRVTQDAEAASTVAVLANKNAVSGATAVEELVTSMNILASDIDKTSHSVEELDEHSKVINSVLTMIEQIAEQTNLLALNAAIEAARAGDAGRGFAVVADEVRNLSRRTTESTQEIHNIIVTLQDGTKRVVRGMSHSRQQAATGVELANKASCSLRDITVSVNELDQYNKTVLQSTSENQQATHEIAINFEPVRKAIDHLSLSTKKSISDSADLTQTASLLQGITSNFGLQTNCAINVKKDDIDKDDVELF